jgi:hypothetical protein
MPEDQAPYGEPPSGLAKGRQKAAIEHVLTFPAPLDLERVTGFARDLARVAAASGREIDEVTFPELLAVHPEYARKQWCALGKIDGLWFALGEGVPGEDAQRIPIGKGRRRTLTAEQLAAAARFDTDLIARRAGREAGFPRTFALSVPPTA